MTKTLPPDGLTVTAMASLSLVGLPYRVTHCWVPVAAL